MLYLAIETGDVILHYAFAFRYTDFTLPIDSHCRSQIVYLGSALCQKQPPVSGD